MPIRAKFKCTELTLTESGHRAKFYPMTSGSPENEQFYKYTPGGSLELGTLKEMPFAVGKAYYLDITEAEEVLTEVKMDLPAGVYVVQPSVATKNPPGILAPHRSGCRFVSWDEWCDIHDRFDIGVVFGTDCIRWVSDDSSVCAVYDTVAQQWALLSDEDARIPYTERARVPLIVSELRKAIVATSQKDDDKA